jgi:hypothetical protein
MPCPEAGGERKAHAEPVANSRKDLTLPIYAAIHWDSLEESDLDFLLERLYGPAFSKHVFQMLKCLEKVFLWAGRSGRRSPGEQERSEFMHARFQDAQEAIGAVHGKSEMSLIPCRLYGVASEQKLQKDPEGPGIDTSAGQRGIQPQGGRVSTSAIAGSAVNPPGPYAHLVRGDKAPENAVTIEKPHGTTAGALQGRELPEKGA